MFGIRIDPVYGVSKQFSLQEDISNPGLKELPQITFPGEHTSSQNNPLYEQVNRNNLYNRTCKTVGILVMEEYISMFKEIKKILKVHQCETFKNVQADLKKNQTVLLEIKKISKLILEI